MITCILFTLSDKDFQLNKNNYNKDFGDFVIPFRSYPVIYEVNLFFVIDEMIHPFSV